VGHVREPAPNANLAEAGAVMQSQAGQFSGNTLDSIVQMPAGT
jgi:hypothetical protein